MTFCTRFAPSPTGPLHLGHAYSAIIGAQEAWRKGGRFLMRIEDLDRSRSRALWEQQIYDDLAWLGLTWEQPVVRQSERGAAYQSAIRHLTKMGLTYACTCRRADIEAAASAPQEGVPKFGPDGRIYPGTCRDKALPLNTDGAVIRLNISKAAEIAGSLHFQETGALYKGLHHFHASSLVQDAGDIILQRRGMAASYHLAVVVDDAAQKITQVTRGADLWEATRLHVLLQTLLEIPVPLFHHHQLIRDEAGKRLAKRDDARAIATYRAEGRNPEDIYRLVGLDLSASVHRLH